MSVADSLVTGVPTASPLVSTATSQGEIVMVLGSGGAIGPLVKVELVMVRTQEPKPSVPLAVPADELTAKVGVAAYQRR